MNLKTRYVVKGIRKEETIHSVVSIRTTSDGARIEAVRDKWDGKLPDSSIQNVSGAEFDGGTRPCGESADRLCHF